MVVQPTESYAAGDTITTTTRSGGGIEGGLFAATLLKIVFSLR